MFPPRSTNQKCSSPSISKIHFWEFPATIAVKPKDKLRCALLEEAIRKFGSSRKLAYALIERKIQSDWKNESLSSWIRMVKQPDAPERRRYLPVRIVTWITKKLRLELEKIEKSIIAYKLIRGRTVVYNPKLPIRVTPEFDSVYAHLCFDGTTVRTKRGHGCYSQYNKVPKMRFHQKLVNVFGRIVSANKNNIIHKTSIDFPAFLTDIFKCYYGIQTPSFNTVGIPTVIKTKPKPFRVAIISTALVDEGTVCDEILLRLANRKLLEDLREIAVSLNYNCFPLRKVGDIYRFGISLSSAKRLLDDINALTKIFPTLDLAHKQMYLERIVHRQKTQMKGLTGETKDNLLVLLKKKPMTVKELCTVIPIDYRTIARHLREMKLQGLVRKHGEKGNVILWGPGGSNCLSTR